MEHSDMTDQLIECRCGCGTHIPARSRDGRPRSYVLGHQNRSSEKRRHSRRAMTQMRQEEMNSKLLAGTKVCPGCDLEQPLENFHFSGKWREVCPTCHRYRTRRNYAMRTYQITAEQFDELMQVTHCAICGVEEAMGEREVLHIDHDHETMKVRGMLCGACNRGLGGFKDSIEFLRQAIAYLEETSDV